METIERQIPARQARRFDSPQQEAFLGLWRTYDRLKAIEEGLFGQFGISAQQYNALRLLRAADPEAIPTLALAERLISRAPDITRLLDRLEAKGLVERTRPAANRRVVLVRITSSGLALLCELDEPVREAHELQLGHLSDQELRTLTDLLRAARRPHEPEGGEWT